MNDKAKPDGEPNVIFLEDELNSRFGAGSVRVICPITDPFVRHHGALGSFVRGYARNRGRHPALMAASAALPGVALVLDRADAARRFELPLDREADFVVLGDDNTAIGASRAEHDLSGLAGHRLRSHGGLGEQLGAVHPVAAADPRISAHCSDAALAQFRYLRFRAERDRIASITFQARASSRTIERG